MLLIKSLLDFVNKHPKAIEQHLRLILQISTDRKCIPQEKNRRKVFGTSKRMITLISGGVGEAK